jgi:dephospho-CoA kinase
VRRLIFVRGFNEFRYYYTLQQKLLNCNTLYKMGMFYGLGLKDRSRVVGLTGGIATGKTTVAVYLASHYGLTILDADLYAREAVSLGSQGLQDIVERYGPGILRLDQGLDRSQLAQIMFQSADEKQWIESLIHPYVRDRLSASVLALHHQPLIVMDIPLLFEASMTDLVTEIWVVSCQPKQQLERLMARNHLTQSEAQTRIDSQMPLQEKCDRADIVLENSGTLEALYAQVDQAVHFGNIGAEDLAPLGEDGSC